jgi:hypothetical protein
MQPIVHDLNWVANRQCVGVLKDSVLNFVEARGAARAHFYHCPKDSAIYPTAPIAWYF